MQKAEKTIKSESD